MLFWVNILSIILTKEFLTKGLFLDLFEINDQFALKLKTFLVGQGHGLYNESSIFKSLTNQTLYA